MRVGWVLGRVVEMRDEIDTGASGEKERLPIVVNVLPVEIPILNPDEVVFVTRWRCGDRVAYRVRVGACGASLLTDKHLS